MQERRDPSEVPKRPAIVKDSHHPVPVLNRVVQQPVSTQRVNLVTVPATEEGTGPDNKSLVNRRPSRDVSSRDNIGNRVMPLCPIVPALPPVFGVDIIA